ncbi:MAG: beta-ketoacyl synthase [Hymenobacter sp.]|nr:MAG: beta-ketoacyl synthase [Hymenobacter sp.]
MALYINGIGNISPAPAFGPAAETGARRTANRLHCQEPNYADYLDARASRRLSRIVKMGTAAALQALRAAGLTATDGVLAGTGWGCLEDTVAFLHKMVVNGEELLSPSAFIHSTHNTIAGQVAYQLKCRGYNNTYVHRNISFESALLDATLLLLENPAANLLLGGIDELTDTSFDILTRLKTFKDPVADLDGPADTRADRLYGANTPGTWAGEGATFFAVSGQAHPTSYAQLLAVRTVSFGTPAEAAAVARTLLAAHGYAQVDLVLSGDNGDAANDAACQDFQDALGPQKATERFKHLCGEYPTASAFALGLAATRLAAQAKASVPASAAQPHSILIYNRFQQAHQSLLLLAAC